MKGFYDKTIITGSKLIKQTVDLTYGKYAAPINSAFIIFTGKDWREIKTDNTKRCLATISAVLPYTKYIRGDHGELIVEVAQKTLEAKEKGDTLKELNDAVQDSEK